MKVNTRITGSDLTEGIGFYGETNYDNETINRLKQLAVVLEDVLSDLQSLDRQVKDRGESSAKEIKWQLDAMRKDILWIIFSEEIAEDIVELLGEKE